MEAFEVITLLVKIVGFIVIISTVIYAVMLIPMYLFLKKVAYQKPWLAFIPGLRWYALTQLAGDPASGRITVMGKEFNKRNVGLLLAFDWALALIPIVGSILRLVLNTLCLGAVIRDIYAVADNRSEEEVIVLAYFSVFSKMILMAKICQYLYLWRGKNA